MRRLRLRSRIECKSTHVADQLLHVVIGLFGGRVFFLRQRVLVRRQRLRPQQTNIDCAHLQVVLVQFKFQLAHHTLHSLQQLQYSLGISQH